MTESYRLPGAEQEGESLALPPAQPPAAFRGPPRRWGRLVSLLRYLSQIQVHTYAFSVAANAILSLFPFLVLMFTIARQVFHSRAMENVIGQMIRYFLPAGQDFVAKNMAIVAHARKGVQIASLVMLLIASTGIFMPLEVALNQVWGSPRNRSYAMNQLVSLGLAFAIGALATLSVIFTAEQRMVLRLLFFGHTNNLVYAFFARRLLRISAAISSILLFFLIYWILPNRKLPVAAVLPTAVVVGLLWELAKIAYIRTLPWLDLHSVYGPFSISVSLMLWAFLTGLLLLAGAHSSASRYALKLAQRADVERAEAERNEL